MTTTPARQTPTSEIPTSQTPDPAGPATIVVSGPATRDVIDIAYVAELIARDGVAAHHQTLEHLADRAAAAGVLPGASAALRDGEAPEATRARAFLAIARRWDSISVAAAQKAAFDQSFAALATQWVAHQELRKHGAITELGQSRDRLNQLRLQTRHSLLSR